MRSTRGDTIIEVMFAFVIFSLVVVGTVMLMNRGVAMAQRSLEVTQVRSQVDAQVDMARYMQRYNTAAWQDLITNHTLGSAPSFEAFSGLATCPQASDLSQAFFFTRKFDSSLGADTIGYMMADGSNFEAIATNPMYSHVDFAPVPPDVPKAYGVWAQITRSEAVGSGGTAYDLHVRACWDSVGMTKPMTIGTVTRLYNAQ